MRFIQYIILATFLVVLILVALANRGMVEVAFLPGGLPFAELTRLSLPLFAIIFVAMVFGLVLGYFMEYFREHKFRHRAAVKTREAAQLAAEVKSLKKDSGKDDDDVLALLN